MNTGRTLFTQEDILGAEIDKTRELLLEDEDEEDFDLPQSAEILRRFERYMNKAKTNVLPSSGPSPEMSFFVTGICKFEASRNSTIR